ncbi:glycosyltransferase family 2 protein [Aequorivita nionensis]|uniref:glycosyltransferase family 2 protein n=1 Tax=Aequorivita nionensis TaxID=1287690 RepID=UPI003965A970
MIPKVSILIPNYNHKPYLQQRLDTVFGQTFQDFEVILLDDASTDGSQEVLERYRNHPKVAHLIMNSNNSGSPFKQWQKGIDLAKGEYIWIAESDDYCELSFLESLLARMNKETGICYSQSIDVDESGKTLLNRIDYTKEFDPNIWKADFEISGLEFIEKYFIIKSVIPNASAVIFRRKLVHESIFRKELLKMKMCGDWFFWLQITLETNVGFLAKDLNYFRYHGKVSRNHTTLKKKKQRLIEEGITRSFFLKNYNLGNKSSEKYYYKKWFRLHQLSSILKPSFYKGKLFKTSIFTFINNFLFFKVRKYKSKL